MECKFNRDLISAKFSFKTILFALEMDCRLAFKVIITSINNRSAMNSTTILPFSRILYPTVFLTIALTLQSCLTFEQIPFEEAKGYFVLNSYRDGNLTGPKITTQEQFETIFGPAPVMGKDGAPTKIDFNTSYAVAAIEPETDLETRMHVRMVQYEEDRVTIVYIVRHGKKQSFHTRPVLLLIIPKDKTGPVVLDRIAAD